MADRPDPALPVTARGYGLSRERFSLLFLVMLAAAAGNTAMQSLLPSIGRALGGWCMLNLRISRRGGA